jgi:hypothetical protein
VGKNVLHTDEINGLYFLFVHEHFKFVEAIHSYDK